MRVLRTIRDQLADVVVGLADVTDSLYRLEVEQGKQGTWIIGLIERIGLMATQDQVQALADANDANTTRILAGVGEVVDATNGIAADLEALKTSNPALDFSAIEASVARGSAAADALDAAAKAEADLDAANPAPAPVDPGF